MSIEEVKRLEADAKTNAQVRNKLKQAGPDPKALASIAAGLGYKLTEADLQQYINDKKGAMSEEDLDKVAGGGATNVQTNVEQTAEEVSTCTSTTETGVETDVVAVGPVVAT
ncbi:MAG: Nif11-like leader peptide family natural product precursor [Desulfarculus sp.]|nr:Nif11-like leader peptide family natural product precursor [Desulfarculus sp.]